MQQLSNDTGSWNLIVAPPPASLHYNSNTYQSISHSSATINDLNNPILPITSLITPPSVTGETTSVNYWAFILIIFPLFTIFGNILVVISVYREKSLHTVTNYFVVSLAISDITVAAVVMPFAIYLEVSKTSNINDLFIIYPRKRASTRI
jgi:dopamine D2-like receptor